MTLLDPRLEAAANHLATIDPPRPPDSGQLVRTSAAIAAFEPTDSAELDKAQPDSKSTWAAIDITAILDGDYTQPEPTTLCRNDGVGMFYEGKTHTLFGSSESGKSWIALQACVERLGKGQKVLYLDHESSADVIVGRLVALGATRKQLHPDGDLFRYVRPDEALSSRGQGVRPEVLPDILTLLGWKPALVIIDGVTEAMVSEDLDPISGASNTDFPKWLSLVPRAFEVANSTVVLVDHTGHGGESGTSKRPIGGQHKKSGITGSAFFVEIVKPFGRAIGQPVEGLIRLSLYKDRPGYLRGLHPGTMPTVADAEVKAWPDGCIEIRLVSPATSSGLKDELSIEIARHLLIYEGDSGRKIAEAIGRTPTDRGTSSALKAMAQRGEVLIKKSGNTHKHTLTALGKQLIPSEELKELSSILSDDDVEAATS